MIFALRYLVVVAPHFCTNLWCNEQAKDLSTSFHNGRLPVTKYGFAVLRLTDHFVVWCMEGNKVNIVAHSYILWEEHRIGQLCKASQQEIYPKQDMHVIHSSRSFCLHPSDIDLHSWGLGVTNRHRVNSVWPLILAVSSSTPVVSWAVKKPGLWNGSAWKTEGELRTQMWTKKPELWKPWEWWAAEQTHTHIRTHMLRHTHTT